MMGTSVIKELKATFHKELMSFTIDSLTSEGILKLKLKEILLH